MAKCNKCGRKGLFFKVNSEGLCPECAAQTLIDKEKQNIEEKRQQLNRDISDAEQRVAKAHRDLANEASEFERLKAERQKMYNEIKRQAESAAYATIKNQIDELTSQKDKLDREVSEIIEQKNKLYSDYDGIQKKYYKVKTQFESYQNANKKYLKENEQSLDDSFISKLEPTIEIELNCMNIRQLRSLFNQNKKQIENCLARYEGRYTTKTNAALYKLMTIALKAELQNILYSIRFGKLDSSIAAVKEITEKYFSIATDGNQSIASTMKKFIGEIEVLFIDAVKIEYEYYVQKERIKEEQRAIKEQMRQEAEERKALEQEKKRIEKEEQKYRNEIDNIKEQLRTADTSKAEILNKRIAELENQISAINDKREQIAALENGKAGYVYIISNIGSFGDDVYKIGMTRRSEPMDRINELGNASVPFPFDVHGLIFSDDAVALEHELHTVFNDNRVNKVNLRKEFFNVSLDNIKKVVEDRCPSAEFHKTALAEQYRQSISMNKALQEIDKDDLSMNLA